MPSLGSSRAALLLALSAAALPCGLARRVPVGPTALEMPAEPSVQPETSPSALAQARGEEPNWADVPALEQCVLKQGRTLGVWEGRKLTIEQGQIKWRSSTDCGVGEFRGPRYWLGAQIKAAVGSERTLDLASLVPGADGAKVAFKAPSDDIPGGAADAAKRCITVSDASREHVWCAPQGQDMETAKSIIEAQLEVLAQAGATSPSALVQVRGKQPEWASAPALEQCVLKQGRTLGVWEGRKLTVEQGQIKWRSSTDCGVGEFRGPRFWLGAQIKAAVGSEKTLDMASLVPGANGAKVAFKAPSDDIPGGAADAAKRCITVSDTKHEHVWCAPQGEDMEMAKSTIEAQLQVLASH